MYIQQRLLNKRYYKNKYFMPLPKNEHCGLTCNKCKTMPYIVMAIIK